MVAESGPTMSKCRENIVSEKWRAKFLARPVLCRHVFESFLGVLGALKRPDWDSVFPIIKWEEGFISWSQGLARDSDI